MGYKSGDLARGIAGGFKDVLSAIQVASMAFNAQFVDLLIKKGLLSKEEIACCYDETATLAKKLMEFDAGSARMQALQTDEAALDAMTDRDALKVIKDNKALYQMASDFTDSGLVFPPQFRLGLAAFLAQTPLEELLAMEKELEQGLAKEKA